MKNRNVAHLVRNLLSIQRACAEATENKHAVARLSELHRIMFPCHNTSYKFNQVWDAKLLASAVDLETGGQGYEWDRKTVYKSIGIESAIMKNRIDLDFSY